MSILYPKGYIKPPVEDNDKPSIETEDLKPKIRNMVMNAGEGVSYSEILKRTQKKLLERNIHFRDKDVMRLIAEVDAEWRAEEVAELEG